MEATSVTVVAPVVGIFLPVLVSLLKSVSWRKELKMLLSIAVSFVAAGATVALDGGLDWGADLWTNASIIWSSSQIVYGMYFGSTGINEVLESTKILGR